MATAVAFPSDVTPAFDFTSLTCTGGSWAEEAFAEEECSIVRLRKERMSAFREDVKIAMANIARDRVSIEELSTEVAKSESLREEAYRAQVAADAVREAVRESLAASARRSEAAAQARDRFLEAKKERVIQLRAEQEQASKANAAAADRLSDVERLLVAYSERLGLVVSRAAPRTVRVAFKLLDAQRPQTEFAFTLGLGAAGTYVVGGCAPALPSDELATLSCRLYNAEPSQAAALPAFIAGMRRAFKRVVEASEAR